MGRAAECSQNSQRYPHAEGAKRSLARVLETGEESGAEGDWNWVAAEAAAEWSVVVSA